MTKKGSLLSKGRYIKKSFLFFSPVSSDKPCSFWVIERGIKIKKDFLSFYFVRYLEKEITAKY